MARLLAARPARLVLGLQLKGLALAALRRFSDGTREFFPNLAAQDLSAAHLHRRDSHRIDSTPGAEKARERIDLFGHPARRAQHGFRSRYLLLKAGRLFGNSESPAVFLHL